MKHFDIEEWADYARGLGDRPTRQSMADHLSAGCAKCESAVAALRRVADLAPTSSRQEPPDYAVRSVKAFFALHRPERAPKLRSLALQLAFDSFLEPAPAGTRSLDTASRHLVYYAQNYALDLRLDCEPGSHIMQLGGEILDRKFGPVPNIPAFLIADDEVVSRSTSSDLGEFNLSFDNDGNDGSLRLCLLMSDEERIDVSLDRCRPKRATLVEN